MIGGNGIILMMKFSYFEMILLFNLFSGFYCFFVCLLKVQNNFLEDHLWLVLAIYLVWLLTLNSYFLKIAIVYIFFVLTFRSKPERINWSKSNCSKEQLITFKKFRWVDSFLSYQRSKIALSFILFYFFSIWML
jgi:hypothetical protein